MALPLKCSEKGIPFSTYENIATVLSHDPLFTGRFWYDEFLDKIRTGAPPREWVDPDDIAVAVELQARYDFRTLGKAQIRDTINYRTRQAPRHVVREWLESLTWDGEPRLAHAFEDHWNVTCEPGQPCDYVRTVSANFFIGMVTRIFQPGCQLDHMVVFESKQGLGKTSALRILGGEWYTVAHEKITRKDFFQDLQGKWLVEISELSAFRNADVERIKSVISTSSDTFRGSYDHRSSTHPRQCVFAGTTNADTWGNDETGLRRFWPVTCGEIHLKALAAARTQLFAEAVAAYREGVTWWEVPAVAEEIQADRQLDDPWEPCVREWLISHALNGAGPLALVDLYKGALNGNPKELTVPDAHRLGRILKQMGWLKRTVRVPNMRSRKGWFSPKP
jgi:predicted P-loop ATPase